MNPLQATGAPLSEHELEVDFPNPLLPSPSQDPYVIWHEGVYHAINTDGRSLFVRRSASLIDLYRRPPAVIWTAPRRGPNSKHVWAPELHFIAGRWFVYFAADTGRNRNHRIWVLESESLDPAGRYRPRGMIETAGWAIDATICRDAEGRLFMLWSGWAGPDPGPQNLYLAPMDGPASLDGPRVLIAEPVEPWEKRGAPICEGPAVLRRNGVTSVVYSAGASWLPHQCLGLLANRGGDYLDPASWQKRGPAFEKTPDVWGVGHCSFVVAEGAHGGVMFYHAKTKRQRGWRDRNIRAQRFTWDAEDLPHLGRPVPPGQAPFLPPSPPGRRRKRREPALATVCGWG